MESFTDADRERLIGMAGQIAALEKGHRVSLRRIRRLPDLTATAIVKAVGRRALFLIGVGIALGSALGSVGFELVRALAAALIPVIGKVGH